ncbi:MAG: hypothetical protein JXR83_16140, partial [Deltaproteobacteria bacterium]|nr:hypothetical protein [Deltaproteobacteria bacterium]
MTLIAVQLLALPAPAQQPGWLVDATAGAGLAGTRGFRIYAIDLDGDDYPDLVTQVPSPTNRHQLRFWHNEPAAGDPGRRLFVDRTEVSRINAHPDWHPGEASNVGRGIE